MMAQHLSSFIFIMLLGITNSYAETSTQTKPKDSNENTSESKKTNTKKADDRGFDPCLFNASLSVCQKDKAAK